MSTGPNPPEEPRRPEGDPSPEQAPGDQPPGSQVQPAPGQAPMRPEDEKLWAIGAHLGPLVLSFVAPLIVWLVFKDRSAFLDRHGKEALNMQISYLIYFAVAGFSIIILVGLVLLPLVGVAWLVLMIVATIKAANYEDYRYPAIFRFVS